MKIENENILVAALRGGINLFLGAGFSLEAANVDGKKLPLGSQLSKELIEHFSLQGFESLSLPQLCTYLNSIRRDELLSYLVNRFTVKTFNPIYGKLSEIEAKWIFSTNIDDLPFHIFASSSTHYLNDIDNRGPIYSDSNAVQYAALHGSVRHPERGFIFGAEELASAFAEDSDRWHFLTQAVQDRPTLFIGYGVNDAGVLQSLNPKSVAGRPTKEKWLLVHPDHSSPPAEAVFRALGFQLIWGTTNDLLEFFGSLSAAPPKVSTKSNLPTRKLFPRDCVPAFGETPLRPVKEFFLGATPEWSDVYSQSIHPTSYFTSVKNAVLAGQNVAILGAPACGKSTLLMQLAATIETSQRKLFLTAPTPEKAQNIATILDGDPCIVFADNFADCFEGMEFLAQVPNVQLVVAERDFMFGIVAHRTHPFGFHTIDVTELSDADVQRCISSIPPDILLKGPVRLPQKIRPSLFETIEANVRLPGIKARFKDVIAALTESDPLMSEVLVMLCYVFSCRTPVSMDMLIAFCRNDISDWQEVSALRSQLGSMVTDYFGEYSSDDQDYFCPRSSFLSEAILDVVPAPLLRHVLIRFHEEVSPARICRYDVFRRRAFSADLFSKAFPEWHSGKDFYLKLMARDPSPYFSQQAALYLSHKSQHPEAFKMIDAAITASQGRVWSIRNSHAIILFRANIGFAHIEAGREQLKKSMETLVECYRWDKRKSFHAFTYAQQALQLHEKEQSSVVEGYLRQAKTWLTEAVKEEPWNRQCRYLLPRIIAIIG